MVVQIMKSSMVQLTMALVEDSCADRKENLAKASVLAQNSIFDSFSTPSRRAFSSCDVLFDSQLHFQYLDC